jgi:hypothetical protein
MSVLELFKPVYYNDIVILGGNLVADERGYDHYICAGVNPDDESFSSHIIHYFGIQQASAFDANISKIPSNYPIEMIYYKRNVSNKKDSFNANLEFFINKYNNIFLKMDIKGLEYDWFSTLNSSKLNKFKQIIICFNNDESFDNYNKLYAFNLINLTHYIVSLNNEGTNINVIYLRKDCIPDLYYKSSLTIEIPIMEEYIPIQEKSPENPNFIENSYNDSSIIDETPEVTLDESLDTILDESPEVNLDTSLDASLDAILDASLDTSLEPETVEEEIIHIEEPATPITNNKKRRNKNKNK